MTDALSRCLDPWRPKFAPASLLLVGCATGGLIGGGGSTGGGGGGIWMNEGGILDEANDA